MSEPSPNARSSHGTPGPRSPQASLRNLAINVAVPLLAIQVLSRLGIAEVPAFALAALFPALQIAVSWVRHRRLEMMSLAILITIVINIALTLATHDVRFALLKASPAFGLFGLACFASLLGTRPLMFFVARYFTAGSDAVKEAAFTAKLQHDGFRRSMRRLTIVWGAGCMLEAIVCVCAAFTLVPNIAVLAEPIIAAVTIGGLLAWTAAYARRREAAVAAAAGNA